MKRTKWNELEEEYSFAAEEARAVSTKEQRHQAFVEGQNVCPLCNSQLTIRVESYPEDDMLREEASCSPCQMLARVKDHKMH